MVEGVINGMVGSPAIFTSIPEVERCNSKVLKEGRVIGAGSERPDPEIGSVPGLFPVVSARFYDPECAASICHADPFFRIDDVAGDLVDEMFKRMGPLQE